MDDIMVENDVLDTAEEKGVIKGIMLTAKNLQSMGFSIADIMNATGLSEDDIKKL